MSVLQCTCSIRNTLRCWRVGGSSLHFGISFVLHKSLGTHIFIYVIIYVDDFNARKG